MNAFVVEAWSIRVEKTREMIKYINKTLPLILNKSDSNTQNNKNSPNIYL